MKNQPNLRSYIGVYTVRELVEEGVPKEGKTLKETGDGKTHQKVALLIFVPNPGLWL